MRHSASLQLIPDGPAGTRVTLQTMASLVRTYRKVLRLRELALSIVRPVAGSKNFFAEAVALCEWVRGSIQYVRDIRDVETIQTPVVTLDYRQGDCDDQATLLATLLECVGFTTRFRAVATDPGGPFVHVLTEALIENAWVPLETTEPWEPGTFQARVTDEMTLEV